MITNVIIIADNIRKRKDESISETIIYLNQLLRVSLAIT